MVWMSWSNFSVSLVSLQPPCLALSSVAWSSATVSSHKVLWSCIYNISCIVCHGLYGIIGACHYLFRGCMGVWVASFRLSRFHGHCIWVYTLVLFPCRSLTSNTLLNGFITARVILIFIVGGMMSLALLSCSTKVSAALLMVSETVQWTVNLVPLKQFLSTSTSHFNGTSCSTCQMFSHFESKPTLSFV